MEEEELIRSVYKQMYAGMISKDETLLREVLDDSFVLVHMTGMRQSKEEFVSAVMNGTLNYFSGRQESLTVEQSGDTAVMVGRSVVTAAVFGGGKHTWRLQQKCDMKKADGKWRITRSVVSTY